MTYPSRLRTKEMSEAQRDRQRDSMRRYYHRTVKNRPYKPVKIRGWEGILCGDNLKRLHEIWHIV